MTAYANLAQNYNTITEMEESVLNNTNADFDYKNGSYLNRIQLGNPLGSLYGFRFKGVYRYNYNTTWSKDRWAQAAEEAAAQGYKLHDLYPVAGDADGNTIYYDLSGRRVEHPVVGRVYLFDGKKSVYTGKRN